MEMDAGWRGTDSLLAFGVFGLSCCGLSCTVGTSWPLSVAFSACWKGSGSSLWLAVQVSQLFYEKRSRNGKGKPLEPIAVVFMISPIKCSFSLLSLLLNSDITLTTIHPISQYGVRKTLLYQKSVCICSAESSGFPLTDTEQDLLCPATLKSLTTHSPLYWHSTSC